MTRFVLLTRDSPEQAALAQRLAGRSEMVGLVICANRPRRPHPHYKRILWNRMLGRIVGRPLTKAWREALEHYSAFEFPTAPTIRTANVNDPITLQFLEETRAELVLVSSTTLVGKRVINWAEQRLGILNLHTGLSPYVNGGPNCANWCLTQMWFHLIGNTVHRVDPGVDSGPIVTTGRPPLLGDESLEALQIKVLDHGHGLYAQALGAIARGAPLPTVPQSSIGVGRTFLTVEWTPKAMIAAWLNHRRYFKPEWFQSEQFRRSSAMVREVSIGHIAGDS